MKASDASIVINNAGRIVGPQLLEGSLDGARKMMEVSVSTGVTRYVFRRTRDLLYAAAPVVRQACVPGAPDILVR